MGYLTIEWQIESNKFPNHPCSLPSQFTKKLKFWWWQSTEEKNRHPTQISPHSLKFFFSQPSSPMALVHPLAAWFAGFKQQLCVDFFLLQNGDAVLLVFIVQESNFFSCPHCIGAWRTLPPSFFFIQPPHPLRREALRFEEPEPGARAGRTMTTTVFH